MAQLAAITAFGVGGATIAGVLIGLFRRIPHRFNDIILGVTRPGIMLGNAAVLGLIVPSLKKRGNV